MSNKKRNKAIRAKYELEKEKKEHPDWCYCDEPDYDFNSPIGKTEPIDGFPYWNSENYTQDIFLCKKCLKKHVIKIVFA
jgi:hypothetical protein